MSGRRIFWAIAALWATLVFGQQPVAWAGSTETIEEASAQEVVGAMANKAVRGIANTTTGWMEFPKQIYQTYKEEGATKGIFIGPLKGLGMTIARTVTGVCEFATFYIAYPGFFDPYIDPEYAWQRER
jgi:putative exosortase-associated protein (TIGR04073 family)